MSTRITLDLMTSTDTGHTARRVSCQGWELSWLPGQTLGRDQAVTGMQVAAAVGRGVAPGGRLRLHVDGWAGELGLSGPDAVARAARPPDD